MAIGFEPMQAFDERVYQAAGAAQSRQQANELALRAYGITQASADRASDRAQQEEQFNASHRQRFQLQDSAQAHDFAKAQQHVDLQVQANQAQLTQSESMRMQALERQLNYAQSALDSGSISTQEYRDITTQLRTGISPLEQRARQAQVLQTQAHTQLTMEQTAQAATRASLSSRFMNGEGPIFHTDEASGQRFYLDSLSGNWQPIQAPRESSAGQSRPMTAAQTAGFRRSAESAVARDPAFIGRPAAEIASEARRRFESWTGQPGAENTAAPRPIELPRDTTLDSREFRALPADQRDTIRSLNETAAIVTGPDSRLPEGVRAEAEQDISQFRDLFFQFGSLDAMPPTERRVAETIARRIQELKTQSLALGAGREQRPPAAAPQNQVLGRYRQYDQGYTMRPGGPSGAP